MRKLQLTWQFNQLDLASFQMAYVARHVLST